MKLNFTILFLCVPIFYNKYSYGSGARICPMGPISSTFVEPDQLLALVSTILHLMKPSITDEITMILLLEFEWYSYCSDTFTVIYKAIIHTELYGYVL